MSFQFWTLCKRILLNYHGSHSATFTSSVKITESVSEITYLLSSLQILFHSYYHGSVDSGKKNVEYPIRRSTIIINWYIEIHVILNVHKRLPRTYYRNSSQRNDKSEVFSVINSYLVGGYLTALCSHDHCHFQKCQFDNFMQLGVADFCQIFDN